MGDRLVTPLVRQQLTEAGWTVLRTSSYRAAQTRQRVADARAEAAIDNQNWLREMLEKECAETRRLRERLTFVYGVAIEHGATREELVGP